MNRRRGVRRLLSAVFVAVLAQPLIMSSGASAAGLTCGQAGLANKSGQTAYVIHSCTGTGTIKYKVDCLAGPDVHFSWVYKGYGASIYKKIKCPGIGRPSYVYWDIQ